MAGLRPFLVRDVLLTLVRAWLLQRSCGGISVCNRRPQPATVSKTPPNGRGRSAFQIHCGATMRPLLAAQGLSPVQEFETCKKKAGVASATGRLASVQ
ncbi:hypothetical protein OF385_07040 [Glutamicibacter sp. JL.03c]|uniref:hypothetical protein n=1 Tax=Glutamicibacter sp. JL.03c TaxID=2984842 RepID=UPI0021F7F70E|nr:hypothetical protein [Glutamicibacter sp. JL.03c]UYQ78886.1 hypothetical protein OF385_07040 [Glutamicibacter sp. JL.03c]